MKKITLSIFILLITMSFTFGNEDDKEIITKILTSVFADCEIKEFRDSETIKTKLRGRYAWIPLGKSHMVKFSDELVALAFEIYLSPNSDDYSKIEMTGFNDPGYEDIANNERLIQVIYYDIKNNKFLGKPNGFPINGLKWMPLGFGDLMEIMSIKSLEIPINGKNSCYLNIDECPDCLGGVTYCFKYLGANTVLTSNKYTDYFQEIKELHNNVKGKIITNCYENQYDSMEPEYKVIDLISW